MAQCNVEISAQSNVVPNLGVQNAPQISGAPRGLELIKSCAKFYANGIAAANPTVQFSHPMRLALNESATSSSGVAKVGIRSVAAICLFLVVLPSLALAAIVWWGVKAPTAKGPEEAAGYASPASAQAASQGLTPSRSVQEASEGQAAPTAQSDIVIHKVKTQPIPAGAGGAPDRNDRPAKISATD
jgi:hypothetical protein